MSTDNLAICWVKEPHKVEHHFAECHKTECHLADCHSAECRGAVFLHPVIYDVITKMKSYFKKANIVRPIIKNFLKLYLS